MRILLGVLVFSLATRAGATTPPPDYILLPVVVSHAQDATGAHWSTAVSFSYSGGLGAALVNDADGSTSLLQPGTFGDLTISAAGQRGPGVMLRTDASDAAQIFLQERVYNEVSPDTGVVVPAVRFRDVAVDQAVHLIGVPIGVSSRTLLRIYDVTLRDADVQVNVFDPSGSLLSSDVVHLITPVVPPLGTLTNPPYAEYRLTVDASLHSSVFIDVEPLTAGSRLWAFATTTDAHSLAVSAVFPAK